MPRKPIEYNKTNFYKIVCKDLNVKELYVGHTVNFRQRKYKHSSDCNNAGNDKWKFKVYQLARINMNLKKY